MNVEALRDRLGVTQEDLGDAVGVSGSTISRIERGEREIGRQLEVKFEDLKRRSASTLLAVDPGLRAAGVAMFEQSVLDDCAVVYCNRGGGPDQWVAMAKELERWPSRTVDRLAIERMETRPGREDAHDALIQLSQVSGGLYALLGGADEKLAPSANDWTRGRPKKVNHRRVRKRLRDDELDVLEGVVESTQSQHEKEVLDAVGIGLSVLSRWR